MKISERSNGVSAKVFEIGQHGVLIIGRQEVGGFEAEVPAEVFERHLEAERSCTQRTVELNIAQRRGTRQRTHELRADLNGKPHYRD